jgi:disulfide bond formation protein DsbB
MHAMLDFRPTHFLISLIAGGLVLTAIYVEPFASLEPCPMCMMQRLIFVLIALVSLTAALHHPLGRSRHLYSGLTGILALSGSVVAGRQVWLQNLPEDRVPACGPGLEYMLDVFPLLEVVEMALVGTGDCAKVQWTQFGLSIPGWSLIIFSIFALCCMYLFRNKNTIKLNN